MMTLKISNLLMLILMILANYAANALPINGKTTGALSAQYPNLFVPAGITFSIWGAIYLLLLIGFAYLQFQKPNQEIIQSIGWLFTLSCLFNILWILAWHYENLPLSLLLMAGILISLILINKQLALFPQGILKATFGIYLGWICIASIANVTAWLVSIHWNAWDIPQESWTILMIAVGTAIAVASIWVLRNPFIGFAVAWALLGIAIKRYQDHPVILLAALTGILIVLIISFFTLFKTYNANA